MDGNTLLGAVSRQHGLLTCQDGKCPRLLEPGDRG
jgi:hypothetical protein